MVAALLYVIKLWLLFNLSECSFRPFHRLQQLKRTVLVHWNWNQTTSKLFTEGVWPEGSVYGETVWKIFLQFFSDVMYCRS